MQFKRHGGRAIPTLICALILAVIGHAVTQAAPHPGIVLTVEKLARVGQSGQEIDGVLRASNGARIVMSFDATKANPRPGDTLRVDLPQEFTNYEIGKRAELIDDGLVAGECVLSAARTVECTFNDAIRGKTDVKGGLELTVRVGMTTNNDTVEFGLNGEATAVPLPGGGGIDDAIGPYTPSGPLKRIGTILEGSPNIRYEIVFNPGQLPTDIGAPDNVRSVTWVDTLSPGQVFDRSKGIELVRMNTSAGEPYATLANQTGSQSATHGQFGVTVAYNDPSKPTQATFTLTGPFSPEANYLLRYQAKVISADGAPVPGMRYGNSARLGNSSKEVTVGASGQYIDTFKASVELRNGFGGFEVTKQLKGEEASSVASGTAAVSVGDYVWFDVNKDGIQDEADKPIEGAVLSLSGPDGESVTDVDGNIVGSVTSDSNGRYEFANLPVLKTGQAYKVSVIAPNGYLPTTEGAADRGRGSSAGSATSKGLTKDGDKDLTLDFGFVKPSVSLGDHVWFDRNDNGVQDPDEKGIKGITVTLTDPEGKPATDVYGNPVHPVKTDGQGAYSFGNLPVVMPGQSYRVTVTPPSGMKAAKSGVASRDRDSSTGFADSQGLTADAERDATLDFGFVLDGRPGLPKTGD